jgi:hypothetical protein
MSKIVNVELQPLPSQSGYRHHLCAALLHGPDGYRCYIAHVEMPTLTAKNYPQWNAAKAAAGEFAAAHGTKQNHRNTLRFFPSVPEEEYAA